MDNANKYNLMNVEKGEMCSATIYSDTHNTHVPLIKSTWTPVLYQYAQKIKAQEPELLQNDPKAALSKYGVADLGWPWDKIVNQASTQEFDRKTFYLTIMDDVEGVVHIKYPKQSKQDSALRVVYIDFVAVAPWNRGVLENKRYSGVGSVLISHVIEFSNSEGFSGLIGLHSLFQAEGFYKKIGMIDFGRDTSYGNMLYFELPHDMDK